MTKPTEGLIEAKVCKAANYEYVQLPRLKITRLGVPLPKRPTGFVSLQLLEQDKKKKAKRRRLIVSNGVVRVRPMTNPTNVIVHSTEETSPDYDQCIYTDRQQIDSLLGSKSFDNFTPHGAVAWSAVL